MSARNRENFLIHTLNGGFDKAASSFSMLTNRTVRIVNSQSILVKHDDDMSYVTEEEGDLYVLVTQIIGEISGKSYLIFSEEESEEIFKALGKPASPELLEAFLLEIDNIISASVISELSNALKLEIYGDVPQLSKLHATDLEHYLKELTHDPTSVIFCNTTFIFDKKEKVHPQFIWKLNSKIFEMISDEILTA